MNSINGARSSKLRRRFSRSTSLPDLGDVSFSSDDAEDENRSPADSPTSPPSSLRWPASLSLNKILHFDALQLQSAACLNQRMLEAVSMESDEEIDVSYKNHYGLDVCFIPRRFHYTETELEPHRRVGDPEMDALFDYLSEGDEKGRGCGAFDDVIAHAAKDYHNDVNSPLADLYRHYHDGVPKWVDYDQIQRGIDVFLAYLPAAACSLFYRSLVGGFSIPKITEVLVATRYLAPSNLAKDGKEFRSAESINRDRKRTMERVMDTAGFVACVVVPAESTKSAAALRPGGKAWEAALRVRALHAKVRRSLLMQPSKRDVSGGHSSWDIERFGVPSNQEDMAATLLAFSVNILLGTEIISGQPLPQTDQRDYLALWRYIGWLLGVDTPETDLSSSNEDASNRLIPIDPCGPRKLSQVDKDWQPAASGTKDPSSDSIIHSNAVLQSIILHLLYPEQNSCEVVSHILSIRPSFTYRSEVCRIILGHPLCDALGLPRSSINWKGWSRVSISNFASHIAVKFRLYAFFLFLRCYTLLTMFSPRWRYFLSIWHAYSWTKFLHLWEMAHAKRMARAASAHDEMSPASKSDKNCCCPFSMVMAPNPTSE